MTQTFKTFKDINRDDVHCVRCSDAMVGSFPTQHDGKCGLNMGPSWEK